MQQRVLVIGLAEATLELIEPWATVGKLPTLSHLMCNGATGRLRSQVPLITPQMWGTIATGQSPGHHGIFDFWQRGPDGHFSEINGSDIKAPPIWQLLSELGLRSGILNVPFTYPPSNINGFMISGEDAPGAHPSIANPRQLYKEITDKFGRYRLKDIFPGGRQKADYLTLIDDDVSKQTDVFEYLLEQKSWDFALVFYSATAIAQHYFWKDMESQDPDNPFRNVVESAYRAVDKAVARLQQAAGPDTNVFVISECGAGPLQSGVQINTLLEKEGFLVRNKQSANKVLRTLVEQIRRNARGYAQKWFPNTLYYSLNCRLARLKGRMQSYLTGSDIDWSQTQAFSRGKEGCIFINLKGRGPRGIVAPGAEYERVRERIINCLEELIDPATGIKAVDRVYCADDLYKGPMLSWAPDLIVGWRNTAYMPTESDRDKDAVFVTRWREYMNWPTTGGHRVDGVLIAQGPGIRHGATIDDADIIDLMPTWLQCLNQPIPETAEGEVIAALFGGPQKRGAPQPATSA
ncbi:MAG: alkaline phosphatase family protein [Pseudomonadota bacterium]